jgi:four helix bundle protein
MKNHKELIVYQKSYQLCLDIYKITKDFPKEEIYGIVSQLRRSAVSIPSNIAEGYRRKSRAEYLQFLRIALGSHSELETQLSLSKDLHFIPSKEAEKLLNDVEIIGQLLYKLIISLEK